MDDNDLRPCDTQPPRHDPAFSGLHLPFVGFSFTNNSRISDLATRKNNNNQRNGTATAAVDTALPSPAAATTQQQQGRAPMSGLRADHVTKEKRPFSSPPTEKMWTS